MNGDRPKIAFVVQRFGNEVLGGAEAHCFSLAVRLKNIFDVHIYTTTCLDYHSWDCHYKAGKSIVEGLYVYRYRPLRRRSRYLGMISRFLFPLLKYLPNYIRTIIETKWIKLQGPYCPDLVEDLVEAKNDFQSIYLMTYLYYPSLFAARSIPNCIYIPTAHDETPFSFHIVGAALRNCRKIFANTNSEKQLIERTHLINKDLIEVVGVGIDISENKVAKERSSKRKLLYLGRISKDKGILELIEMYRKLKGIETELHLVGRDSENLFTGIEDTNGIIFHGFVTHKKKWELIHGADLLICPSHLESLSMMTLEGILAKKPVLLNWNCLLFQEYEKLYASVYTYRDHCEFCSLVKELCDPLWNENNKKILLESKERVESQYGWKKVLSHFTEGFVT